MALVNLCETFTASCTSVGYSPKVYTMPSGNIVSCLNAYSSDGWKAFDGIDTTAWDEYFGHAKPWLLGYKAVTPLTLSAYAITYPNLITIWPTAWTFQGSNDATAINNGTWTTLDTQTGQTFSLLERKQYAFAAPVTYAYYRLSITGSNGGNNQVFIGTLELLGETSTAPTVTTSPATDITPTTATGNGNVTADGGATITERGICVGTTANPTVADAHFTASGTTGAFTASLTGLAAATTYHARAYATNSVGTSYGADVTFTTAAPEIHLYANGMDGGTDGTKVSEDGSGAASIAFPTLGATVTAHLRCTDDTKPPVPVIVTAPDYFEASADGATWGATASITAGDVNAPVYLRQTAALPRGSASVCRLLIDYGGALVEGIVPTLSGTLTLTPAAHSLLADGPDATDASGIDHYEWQIANNSAFVAPSSSTSAVSAQTFASLSDEVDYYVRYRAVDAYGNASAWLTAHSKPADTTAPSQVTGLAATNGDTQSVLTWTAATDARSAQSALRYKVYKDGVYLATTTAGTLTYTATGLTNGTPVTFTVSALDEANNEGAVSEGKTATPASAGFTDNFDRASLGSTWNATGGGSLSISANKLAIGGSSGWTWANANAGATVLNARVSVKYKTGTVGVFLRRNGFESYAFTIDANAVSRVRKTSSATGEYANLGSVGWGYPADGDKLTLEINGSTIKAYKNDVLKLTVSDAQFPGAGAFGVMSTSTGCTADDFVMEVL